MAALEKRYETDGGSVHALAPTDLVVPKGQFLVLLGPSGCGKTTMLRIAAGLIEPSGGRIDIGGRNLWQNGTRQGAALSELGIVFQEANLFPWLTIEENIALPLQLKGVAKSERLTRARDFIRLVGLVGFERRWPRELSGGMRQRAAIARAMSYDPQILLMDEPFGALDAMTRDTMNLDLQRIWLETGRTIVLVTHSITEAVFLADKIVLLSPRPGRIDTEIDVSGARPRSLDFQSQQDFLTIVKSLRSRLAEIS